MWDGCRLKRCSRVTSIRFANEDEDVSYDIELNENMEEGDDG